MIPVESLFGITAKHSSRPIRRTGLAVPIAGRRRCLGRRRHRARRLCWAAGRVDVMRRGLRRRPCSDRGGGRGSEDVVPRRRTGFRGRGSEEEDGVPRRRTGFRGGGRGSERAPASEVLGVSPTRPARARGGPPWRCAAFCYRILNLSSGRRGRGHGENMMGVSLSNWKNCSWSCSNAEFHFNINLSTEIR